MSGLLKQSLEYAVTKPPLSPMWSRGRCQTLSPFTEAFLMTDETLTLSEVAQCLKDAEKIAYTMFGREICQCSMFGAVAIPPHKLALLDRREDPQRRW